MNSPAMSLPKPMKKTTPSPLFWLALVLCCVSSAAESLLVNGDFEMGDKGWSLSKQAEIRSFSGCDGTAALLLQTHASSIPEHTVQQSFRGVPGDTYTLELWLKLVELNQGALQIDVSFWDKKDKPLSGYEKSLTVSSPNQVWTPLNLDFTVPLEASVCSLAISFTKDATGTAWIDKVSITPAARPFSLALIHPVQGMLDCKYPLLRVAVFKAGQRNLQEALIQKTLRLSWNGRQALRAAQPVVELKLEPPPPEGLLNLRVELLDNESQAVDTTLQTTLRVHSGEDDRACHIDSRQRAIVDGQPFLPIGIAIGRPTPDAIPPAGNLPFNCVLLDASSLDGIASLEELCAALDAWRQRGLRVVFPVPDDGDRWSWYTTLGPTEEMRRERLLPEFAGHPALLAWQLHATSQPDDEIHRQLNRIDANHPVWLMLNGTRLMPEFRRDGDLLGAAFALPATTEEAPASLSRLLRTLEELEETRLGFWTLLAFPSGNGSSYADSIRAAVLLMAMRGARGIFFDLTGHQLDTAEWGTISEAATLLQDLSPYLLSNIPPREIPLQQKKGRSTAREYMDHHGNRILLLAGGFQAGKTEALFQLPETAEPVSRFGHVRRVRKGTWSFTGKGICYDLLLLPAAKRP